MKRITALILIISLAVFMLVSAGSCKIGSRAAEKITEEVMEKAAEESGVTVDKEEDEITIKTEEGEATIGGGTDLPEGFPSAVPVYPDMEISSSWRVTENEVVTFSVSGITGDSGKSVFDWYKSKLDGWEKSESSFESEGEATYSISANNEAYELLLWISESDGETTVVITVNEL